MANGFPRCLGSGRGGEELEVELLIDLWVLVAGRHGEQLVSHGGKHAEVAGGMLREGDHHLRCHELRAAGLLKDMTEPLEQVVGGQVIEGEPDAQARGDG